MTEQDLVDLGFARFDEVECVDEFCYYSLTIGGLEFISNDSEDWVDEDISVEIADTEIVFNEFEDLNEVINILRKNEL